MSERSSSGVDGVVGGGLVDIVKVAIVQAEAKERDSALDKDNPDYWMRAFSYLAESVNWHDDDLFSVVAEVVNGEKIYYIIVEEDKKEFKIKLVDLSERPKKLPRIFVDQLILKNLDETFVVAPGVNGAPKIDLNAPVVDPVGSVAQPASAVASPTIFSPFPLKVLQHFDFDDPYLAPVINFHMQVVAGLEKGLTLLEAVKQAVKILRLDLFKHVGLDHAEQFMNEHFDEFLRVYIEATLIAEQDYTRNRVVKGKDAKNIIAQPLLSAGLSPRNYTDYNSSYGHADTFGFVSVVVAPTAQPYSLAISPNLPISPEVRANHPLLSGYSNGIMRFAEDRVLEMLDLYEALRVDVLSWLPKYRKEMNGIGYKLAGPKHTTAVFEHPDLGRKVEVSSWRDETDAKNDSHYKVWIDLMGLDIDTREVILFYAERASVNHEIGGNHANVYFTKAQLASVKELAQKLHEIMSKRVTIAE